MVFQDPMALEWPPSSHLSRNHVFPTCDAVMRDWSRRPVRSEEETLAGAPRWSLMATFLSRSARSARPAWGERLPAQRCTLEWWKPESGSSSPSLFNLNFQPRVQTSPRPDCWTPRVAGLDGAASASFLALLAADGFGPGGRARPPAPLWPPPARSSPSFPSLLSLSPSSVVLLGPCSTEEQRRHDCTLEKVFKSRRAGTSFWTWDSQTSACSSRRRSHRRSPVCGKDSWRAAEDMSSPACHQTSASGTNSDKWRTQLRDTKDREMWILEK